MRVQPISKGGSLVKVAGGCDLDSTISEEGHGTLVADFIGGFICRSRERLAFRQAEPKAIGRGKGSMPAHYSESCSIQLKASRKVF